MIWRVELLRQLHRKSPQTNAEFAKAPFRTDNRAGPFYCPPLIGRSAARPGGSPAALSTAGPPRQRRDLLTLSGRAFRFYS